MLQTTIREELSRVRMDDRAAVRAVRAAFTAELGRTGDALAAKNAANALKKSQCGYLTFSGEFDKRTNNGLRAHSGVVMYDLDDIADVEGSKAGLAECPHVGAVFLSVRATGLRVLVPVIPIPKDAAEHRAAYYTALPIIEAAAGVKVEDHAGEDVSRASFITSDSCAHMNMDAVPVPWTLPKAATRPPIPEAPRASVPSAEGNQMIILPGGKVSITVCADQLFRRIEPSHTLFSRGGAIMERATEDDGTIKLALVKPAAFRSRIEGFGNLFVWRSGNHGGEMLKPANCPEETAKALMESREAVDLLPKISSVVNCPVMIEKDGELKILGPGYHKENGGVLVVSGERPPDVPICEAVEALKGLVGEFDFQTPGDRSRALASLVTPALKLGGFIRDSIPADVAEADQSQSGKTYRQRVIAAIYREKIKLVAIRKGGVGSLDESFSQALIEGKPFIQLDNVRGKLDSPFIEAFLTANDSIGARVPGRGEIQVDPRRFLLMMTSNGVECTRDFANRSSIIRIRKRVGFTYHVYPEDDLLSHVKANQPYYLGCVFAVIREWIGWGKLRTNVTEHDFKEWAKTLDWIVQNVFHSAPLLDGHLQAQERVSDPALTFLRMVALEVRSENRLGQTLFASDIVDLCEEAAIEIPGLKSANEGAAKRMVGTLMKRAFGTPNTAVVDEFRVERFAETQARPDGGGSYEVKAYQFTQC